MLLGLSKVQSDLAKRIQSFPICFSFASLLDPRTTAFGWEDDEDKVKELWNELITEGSKLLELKIINLANSAPAAVVVEEAHEPRASHAEEKNGDTDALFDAIFSPSENKAAPRSKLKPVDALKQEVNVFKHDLSHNNYHVPRPGATAEETGHAGQKRKRGEENDPLTWWKENASRYPILCRLARRYLCIQGSACASERIFSCGGLISTEKRSTLKSDKVEDMIFLQTGLRVAEEFLAENNMQSLFDTVFDKNLVERQRMVDRSNREVKHLEEKQKRRRK